MSIPAKIGVIEREKIDVTWKILNFFSYREETYYSPEFRALNSTWQIEINPNGRVSDYTTGYVSLYLYKVGYGKSKPIDFGFGIKAAIDVIAYRAKVKIAWEPTTEGWGFPHFITVSELRQNEKTLVPQGILTIICSMNDENDDDFDIEANKNKLITDFMLMFISKKNTDITIKVKKESFSAHSFVLAARSPVLAAMLQSDMMEKKTGFISISDCDPKAFSRFLRYLYSGELGMGNCNFFHLYKIADKYDVPDLKLICLKFINRNISLDSFCETYVFGSQFSEEKLLKNIQNFFEQNFEKVLSLDSWLFFLEDNARLANNLLKTMAPKIKI